MLSGARRTTWLYYNPTLFLERYEKNYKKAPTKIRNENRVSHFRSACAPLQQQTQKFFVARQAETEETQEQHKRHRKN